MNVLHDIAEEEEVAGLLRRRSRVDVPAFDALPVRRHSGLPMLFAGPLLVATIAGIAVWALGDGRPLDVGSPPAGPMATTPTQPQPGAATAVSDSLGGVRLAMTRDEVRALLGEPTIIDTPPAPNLVEWRYAGRISVFFTRDGADASVRQIALPPDSTNRTDEGFSLGMSRAQFRETYAHFPITGTDSGSLLAVRSGAVVLTAAFGPDGRAVGINMREEGVKP